MGYIYFSKMCLFCENDDGRNLIEIRGILDCKIALYTYKRTKYYLSQNNISYFHS